MNKLSKKQVDEAVWIYSEGYSPASIGKHFGVSGVAITWRLRQRNIQLRHAHIKPLYTLDNFLKTNQFNRHGTG